MGCCLPTPRAKQPTDVGGWVYEPFRGQVNRLNVHSGHGPVPTCPSPPQGDNLHLSCLILSLSSSLFLILLFFLPFPFSFLSISPLSLNPFSLPFSLCLSLSALFSLPPLPFYFLSPFLVLPSLSLSLFLSLPLPVKDNTMKTDTLIYASQASTPIPTQLYFRSPDDLCT